MEISHQKKGARLYVEEALGSSLSVSFTEDQCHYLLNVLRYKEGDTVCLFNGRDGEWRATLQVVSKKRVAATCEEKLREQSHLPSLWLAFSPLKKHRQDMLIEKTTEVGVTHLVPVTLRYTNMTSFNMDKVQAQVIEAAEQSERLSVPTIQPLRKLEALLKEWPKDRILYVALERLSDQRFLTDVLEPTKEAGFLIGPEGGFAPEEVALLKGCPFVHFFSLGSLILRAETAAVLSVGVCNQLRKI